MNRVSRLPALLSASLCVLSTACSSPPDADSGPAPDQPNSEGEVVGSTGEEVAQTERAGALPRFETEATRDDGSPDDAMAEAPVFDDGALEDVTHRADSAMESEGPVLFGMHEVLIPGPELVAGLKAWADGRSESDLQSPPSGWAKSSASVLVPDGYESSVVRVGDDLFVALAKAEFDQDDLDPEQVEATIDASGRPALKYAVKAEAQDRFAQWTESLVGKPVAITATGQLLSMPLVMSPISGPGMIHGGPDDEEARRIIEAVTSSLDGR